MTGYGSAKCELSIGTLTVELKSLNGKSLDLSLRAPSWCRPLEAAVRSAVTAGVQRGKTEMNISLSTESKGASNGINREAFSAYLTEIKAAASEAGLELSGEQLLPTIMRMPEVMGERRAELTEGDAEIVLTTVQSAIKAHIDFREQEGEVLITDILSRVNSIGELLEMVKEFEAERIETVKTRLNENLAKAAVSVDSNRFEAEIIYYLEKFDVTEEKVRLSQHLKYFGEVASEGGEVGRKLGFIAQEMGREINTLGSKANHSGMQRVVVQMKDELEKIKEQLLNVL